MALSIGVLITNYNSWKLALECLDANVELCGSHIETILLIDDCSTVPSPPLPDYPDNVQFIRNEQNMGLIKTLNKGMKLLQTDIVVIFDADARPLNDYSQRIVEEFNQQPDLGLIGFRCVDAKGNPAASHEPEPGVSSLILGQALYQRLGRFLHSKDPNQCIYTCSMAVRRETFWQLDGFDEKFDWLEFDLDFSMRIHRSHWSLKVIPELVAFHLGGGSPQITSHRVLRHYRNRWYLLKKFNKIPSRVLAKSLILARLRTEYLVFRLFGIYLSRDANVRHDKLAGRRQLIRYCQENY